MTIWAMLLVEIVNPLIQEKSGKLGDTSSRNGNVRIKKNTLQSSVEMENPPFIDEFPIEASIYTGGIFRCHV